MISLSTTGGYGNVVTLRDLPFRSVLNGGNRRPMGDSEEEEGQTENNLGRKSKIKGKEV